MKIQIFLAKLGGASSLIRRANPTEYKTQSILGILSIISIVLYCIAILSNNFIELLNKIKIEYLYFLIIYPFLLLLINQFFLSRISNIRLSDEKLLNSINLQLLFLRLSLSIGNGFLIYKLFVFINGFSNEDVTDFSVEIYSISLALFELAPFMVKLFRKSTPYDFLVEIENKRLKTSYNAKINQLKSTLNNIENNDSLVYDNDIENIKTNEDSFIFIQDIEITNIRSIENIALKFRKPTNELAMIVSIIGDNSIGKSTILKAIALGTTDESGCVALMKSDNESYISKGKKEGKIEITLFNKKTEEKYIILTKLLIDKNSGEEIVRKEFKNCDPKLLKRNLFICGYGSHRNISGDKSIKEYSTYEALLSLFRKEEKLLNPELILLRENSKTQQLLLKKLESIIVNNDETRFTILDSGININGIPSNASSDGFVSTMNWVLDLFGRAIALGMLRNNDTISGIVLIDELEQHLHPNWQRLVIKKLKSQFPNIQFIITTHTPTIIAGTSDFEDTIICSLEKIEEKTAIRIIKNEFIENKTSSEILLENFGLKSLKSPKAIETTNRYTELLSIKEKSEKEELELQSLKKKLSKDHDKITELENNLIEKLKKY